MIHDDKIELSEFTGCFSPFDLDELEMKVCKLADHQEEENDFPQGDRYRVPKLQSLSIRNSLITISGEIHY